MCGTLQMWNKFLCLNLDIKISSNLNEKVFIYNHGQKKTQKLWYGEGGVQCIDINFHKTSPKSWDTNAIATQKVKSLAVPVYFLAKGLLSPNFSTYPPPPLFPFPFLLSLFSPLLPPYSTLFFSIPTPPYSSPFHLLHPKKY